VCVSVCVCVCVCVCVWHISFVWVVSQMYESSHLNESFQHVWVCRSVAFLLLNTGLSVWMALWYESCRRWMSHVTHEWVVSHVWVWWSGAIFLLDTCRTCHLLAQHKACVRGWLICMSHVTDEWVLSHMHESHDICMSHMTHAWVTPYAHESWHESWVMSHTSTGRGDLDSYNYDHQDFIDFWGPNRGSPRSVGPTNCIQNPDSLDYFNLEMFCGWQWGVPTPQWPLWLASHTRVTSLMSHI